MSLDWGSPYTGNWRERIDTSAPVLQVVSESRRGGSRTVDTLLPAPTTQVNYRYLIKKRTNFSLTEVLLTRVLGPDGSWYDIECKYLSRKLPVLPHLPHDSCYHMQMRRLYTSHPTSGVRGVPCSDVFLCRSRVS